MTGMSVMLMGLVGGNSGSSAVITLSNYSNSDSGAGAPVTVKYRLDSDGNAYFQNNSSVDTLVEQWVDPTSANGDFECRATITGYTDNGSYLTGNFGAWSTLVSSEQWTITQSVGGFGSSVTFTLEIRDAVTLTVRDSATITIAANRTS